MFGNLGRALRLLRELRDLSQGQVARDAGIGKSQLSKYENGKELPKLESLAKVLKVLRLGPFEFFYTMHMLDRRAADLAAADARGEPYSTPDGGAGDVRDQQLLLQSLLPSNPLLTGTMDQAFSRIMQDVLAIYGLLLEQRISAGLAKSGEGAES